MLIRVNKNTGTRRQPVKYAALSTGTISHVWYDEESDMLATAKRRNRIKLTTDKSTLVLKPQLDA